MNGNLYSPLMVDKYIKTIEAGHSTECTTDANHSIALIIIIIIIIKEYDLSVVQLEKKLLEHLTEITIMTVSRMKI